MLDVLLGDRLTELNIVHEYVTACFDFFFLEEKWWCLTDDRLVLLQRSVDSRWNTARTVWLDWLDYCSKSIAVDCALVSWCGSSAYLPPRNLDLDREGMINWISLPCRRVFAADQVRRHVRPYFSVSAVHSPAHTMSHQLSPPRIISSCDEESKWSIDQSSALERSHTQTDHIHPGIASQSSRKTCSSPCQKIRFNRSKISEYSTACREKGTKNQSNRIKITSDESCTGLRQWICRFPSQRERDVYVCIQREREKELARKQNRSQKMSANEKGRPYSIREREYDKCVCMCVCMRVFPNYRVNEFMYALGK